MSMVDLFLTLLVNFAWGFNFIAGKVGAETFQPLFFTSIRFFILFLIMLPWLKPVKGFMFPLLRVSFLLGVVHFGMIFIGLHAGGNIASVAIATQLYVPFSAVLAALFLKERMTPLMIMATVVALSGVCVIGFDPVVFDHLDGVLWVSGAAFAMAVATILMRQCPNLGIFTLQAWIGLVAAPSLLLLSFLFESDHGDILRSVNLIDYWSPLYSAVAASVIGHGTVYYLVGKYPVSVVTPQLLLAPILASFFGVLVLQDQIGWKLVVGGTMTLVGILAITLKPGIMRNSK